MTARFVLVEAYSKFAPLPSSIPQGTVFSKSDPLTWSPPEGQRGILMKAASVKSFSKKLACPSSNLLLSFQHQALAPEINFLVKHHLASCDFCYCEIPLLTFYRPPLKGECRPPELPINLRVLAESILGQDRSAKVVAESSTGKGLTFTRNCEER